ncbi:MAG: carboxylating nicotinate-nucleotide diphosphorylase [Firmicutes bacterium]|nr:carboxylating nicotinate-nucleotide diphosphorylase [Bacillota bacterium]
MFNPQLDQKLLSFLAEDLGSGDVTSRCFPDPGTRTGWYTARRQGVIAGLPFARRLFELMNVDTWHSLVGEGETVEAGARIARVEGPGDVLLQVERLSLNLIQRLSGIATKTRQLVRLISGTKTRVTDTRKTAPGLRYFDKYAVRAGGGFNHRWGLYDAVLIKDNHIKLAGGIANALECARQMNGHAVKIEVEAESLAQVEQALAGSADIIMLDNMSPELVARAVGIVNGRAITEASGNIDATNIVDYARAGVDYISIGALTHTVTALDIGFDLDQPKT